MIVLKHGCALLLSVVTIIRFQAGAPSADAPTEFDVSSIRATPDRSGQASTWIGIRVTGDTFEARGMSLESLVWFAYGNQGSARKMVSGGGGWISSNDWDIVAKVDDPSLAPLSDSERKNLMRPMVQALLVERFRLKVHTETRPTPVYLLVQAKGGAKVKEVSAPPAVDGDWHEALKAFREKNPGRPFPGAIQCSLNGCTARAVKMPDALGQIQASSHADRMVIDGTGLLGYYDFSFRNPVADDSEAMGEIEEDLGMRFESRKVDIATYVIDSAQLPTPN